MQAETLSMISTTCSSVTPSSSVPASQQSLLSFPQCQDSLNRVRSSSTLTRSWLNGLNLQTLEALLCPPINLASMMFSHPLNPTSQYQLLLVPTPSPLWFQASNTTLESRVRTLLASQTGPPTSPLMQVFNPPIQV